jgi:DNA repair protein RecO (recombination protein O)
MPLYSLDAVVIKSRNLGEADKLITLYSRERGKVRAVARGARRPRNRLAASTEIFTHGNYLLFANQGLDNISQCEITESFRGLRESLEGAAAATYCLEIVERMTEEEEPGGDLFPFLLAMLRVLAADEEDLELAVRVFELGLLARLGYLPEFSQCVNCGCEVKQGASFSAALGGVLCGDCRTQDRDAPPVAPDTLAAVRFLVGCAFKPSAQSAPDWLQQSRTASDYPILFKSAIGARPQLGLLLGPGTGRNRPKVGSRLLVDSGNNIC